MFKYYGGIHSRGQVFSGNRMSMNEQWLRDSRVGWWLVQGCLRILLTNINQHFAENDYCWNPFHGMTVTESLEHCSIVIQTWSCPDLSIVMRFVKGYSTISVAKFSAGNGKRLYYLILLDICFCLTMLYILVFAYTKFRWKSSLTGYLSHVD